MKKIELSNFNTVGDLVDYFDNNFALTTWANKSFLEYYDQKEAQTWIRLFISLIDEESLEIVEYDYIYDNLLDDESKSKDPLWGKVQPYFHGKGNYITTLRMNVVHFIAASERFFDADKCKVEVVTKIRFCLLKLVRL